MVSNVADQDTALATDSLTALHSGARDADMFDAMSNHSQCLIVKLWEAETGKHSTHVSRDSLQIAQL